MNDHPVVEMEAKLAYQEVLLNQMSDVLYKQQQQLDLLSSRFNRVVDRLQALEASSTGAESDDWQPPPHY